MKKKPVHIAIIMDGNGRWAKERDKPRTFGHQRGVDAVKKTIKEASRLEVPYITLYTFSTENKNRPKEEIDALMDILASSLIEEEQTLINNNIRLTTIGDTNIFPEKVQNSLQDICKKTAYCNGLCLSLALNYGSHEEIIRAVKNIAQQTYNQTISPDLIDSKFFEQHLYTSGIPAPDLMIRTGGEVRLSNYLLWQLAYSELYFMEKYWPDFNEQDLQKAIIYYQGKERRFGKTSEQVKL